MQKKRVHAFGNDILGKHDAVGLAELIKKGDVSPEELARAAVLRIEKVNGELNAVQLADYEKAVSEAGNTSDGVFRGVPSFIKDNTDVKGMPTLYGSRAVSGNPARKDGAFTKQYKAQGFTILGKTTLPEFGFNCTTEHADAPPTRNPWNTGYSSGGSSGGSAALVAAGAVPIAHGNDGGGSIRIPAACCGLVGLKPTRGRLVDGEMARMMPVNIIGEGVLTRSVRDTAHFFAGAERYFCNRRLPAVGLVEGPARRRLKIGLVLNSVIGNPVCPKTRETVEETARLLEKLGHHVEEMELQVKTSFVESFIDYWGFLAFSISRLGRYTVGSPFYSEKLDGLTTGLADSFSRHKRRLPLAIFRLKRSRAEYKRVIEKYDITLSPVLTHVTPELGYLSPELPFEELFKRMMNYVSFTPINNSSGSPAISLPMGESPGGVPIGVQFSAAHGNERTLLEMAFELEEARPWRKIY